MDYWTFRQAFFDLGCFNINQVYAWQPEFDKNNITRWVKGNRLIKLRNSFYSFPEYLNTPNFSLFVAKYIYMPSYVSLQYALAYYGLIPEAVFDITSVTSRKTNTFSNKFGRFTYRKMLPEYMFGYVHKQIETGSSFMLATPEKAIVDLLHLFPFYDSHAEMEELRLDIDFLTEDIDIDILWNYAHRMGNQQLNQRIGELVKTYQL